MIRALSTFYKNIEAKKIIKKSGMFDEKFYLLSYPDIRKGDLDPLKHYIQFGWKEGRNPNSTFESQWYISTYEDVRKLQINPFVHYILFGRDEKRFPNRETYIQDLKEKRYEEQYHLFSNWELFDKEWYLSSYSDVGQSGADPIEHYILHGENELRQPNQWLDIQRYLAANSDVKKFCSDNFNTYTALYHFVKYGMKEIQEGMRGFYSPKLLYVEARYLNENPDVQLAVDASHLESPFMHFLQHGCHEILEGKRFDSTYFSYWKTEQFKKDFLSNVVDPEHIRMSEVAKLSVPTYDSYQVSIVIPAYNNANYTYNAICSIVASNPKTTYEIIVMDDNSTQEDARNLTDWVQNIRLIVNRENLGFVRNCNTGASFARGEYILFLNNDVHVMDNWLDSLVELMERDDSVGMAGSKLIYPNGMLQEAGGIFWKDGSAWNYGRYQNPLSPEFCYLKEVDYISGASIIIKKNLWDEIGGFDERYVPAYAEDADLAFEVRAKGKKVMFQPASMLVHFEGISHGADTSNGIKRYQVDNLKKLYDKWKTTLEKEHFINGTNVFLARDRSKNKKHILVVDHYVPEFDKDAGSRALFNYLELFTNLNCHVTFITDNFYQYEPYTSILQAKGVEVLYDKHYEKSIYSWIQDTSKYFDFILLCRPHISKKYIDAVRLHSKAKIWYLGVDLHYLRMEREYKISKNHDLLEEIQQFKKMETELMLASDISLTYSTKEKEVIQELDNRIDVGVIPLFFSESEEKEPEQDFDKREDSILFVGGFTHTPNYDAVQWFLTDIFPKIQAQLGSVKFYIAGSNMPDTIKNIKSTNIVPLGFISDSELETLYNSCKVAVIPLRFGAGVKGKVVESIMKKVPVVTTDIGAEGLENIDQILTPVNSEEEFSASVLAFLQDSKYWYDTKVKYHQYSNQYFTNEYAAKIIQTLMKR